jgi:uncharacterized membrane protein
MPKMICIIRIMLQLLLVISIIIAPIIGQNSTLDNSTSKRFILDIYPNRAGDALVIGYADNLKSLQFLKNSEYKYNNGTKQLFARTNALTRKKGDLWTLRFTLLGRIDGYYTAFYLPTDVKLKGVNRSVGSGYLISMRNESLVVEVQGYEVEDPVVTIEYQQPLAKADEGINPAYIYFSLAMALLAISLTFLVKKVRERGRKAALSENQHIDCSKMSIKITAELEAVMKTLTENELTVLRALLGHEGCMTQVDLRYETNTPKSSLSGILLSLERRKIITKKDLGRTNLIELSDKFLPKDERS